MVKLETYSLSLVSQLFVVSWFLSQFGPRFGVVVHLFVLLFVLVSISPTYDSLSIVVSLEAGIILKFVSVATQTVDVGFISVSVLTWVLLVYVKAASLIL